MWSIRPTIFSLFDSVLIFRFHPIVSWLYTFLKYLSVSPSPLFLLNLSFSFLISICVKLLFFYIVVIDCVIFLQSNYIFLSSFSEYVHLSSWVLSLLIFSFPFFSFSNFPILYVAFLFHSVFFISSNLLPVMFPDLLSRKHILSNFSVASWTKNNLFTTLSSNHRKFPSLSCHLLTHTRTHTY